MDLPQNDDDLSESVDQLVIEIVEEIANEEGVHPTDLPPLSEEIDIDAVARLKDSSDIQHPILTTYYGYEISITGEYDIEITTPT